MKVCPFFSMHCPSDVPQKKNPIELLQRENIVATPTVGEKCVGLQGYMTILFIQKISLHNLSIFAINYFD